SGLKRVFVFFFSSRRRHTGWPRDWSSGVCSSDLLGPAQARRGGGRVRAPDVRASDARVQDVAHEADLQPCDAAVLVADREEIEQIGRASCRERVKISGVAVPLKKKILIKTDTWSM